jgi:uncharacterized protein (TIGR00661 family)
MQYHLKGKRIMVAVLNWGLGHATRSMPIIRKLKDSGAVVFLAGDGPPLQYLREAFPELEAIELPAYNIRYPSGLSGAWKTVFQAPAIIQVIRHEREMVARLAQELSLDAIISDNRYGAHTEHAVSIFMCHQLRVLPPKGFRWATPVIFRWHKSFFSRFDHIWVPDFEGENNLSGLLSHGLKTGLPTHYIGPLSRFELNDNPPKTNVQSILALLSGPEPQRSIFEAAVREQLQLSGKRAILVRGVVENTPPIVNGQLKIISYVQQPELNVLLNEAECVVCRPGYSTLMDLSKFRKKVILIPTPGQTEQEYLAERLAEKGQAILQRQNHFNLEMALEQLALIKPLPDWEQEDDLLEKALMELSTAIKRHSPLKK